MAVSESRFKSLCVLTLKTLIQVIINYVGLAVFAVLLLIIYFLTIYDPSADPFKRKEDVHSPLPGNPIDKVVLGFLRSISRKCLVKSGCSLPKWFNEARIESLIIKVTPTVKRPVAHIANADSERRAFC